MSNERMIYADDFLDLFYAESAGQDKSFIKAVEMVVEDTPTIDAVEVVRCGECMFAKNLRSAYVDCKVWRSSVPRDGYCYNGARKMDAEVCDVDK